MRVPALAVPQTRRERRTQESCVPGSVLGTSSIQQLMTFPMAVPHLLPCCCHYQIVLVFPSLMFPSSLVLFLACFSSSVLHANQTCNRPSVAHLPLLHSAQEPSKGMHNHERVYLKCIPSSTWNQWSTLVHLGLEMLIHSSMQNTPTYSVCLQFPFFYI